MISFIIPVYKTPELLLRNCLDSVLRYAQPMELICVLDSPGDACEVVLDEYAQRDARIRLLKNDCNRGVSYARNRGVDAAQGEWLAFVDADDEIVAATYSRAVNVAINNGVVGCAFTRNPSCGDFIELKYGDVITGSIFDEDVSDKLARGYMWAVYPMIISRQFLLQNHISFPIDCRYCEDFCTLVEILCSGAKFSFLNEYGYKSVGHPQSACKKGPTDALFIDSLRSISRIVNRLSEIALPRKTMEWYLYSVVIMVLQDLRVRSCLSNIGRDEYMQIFRDFLPVFEQVFHKIMSCPMRLIVCVLRRWSGVWLFPGMPLSFLIKLLRHYNSLSIRR